MKNVFKLFGVIALVAIIGFSMTACSDGGDGGGGPNPVMRTVTFDANGGTVEGAATKDVKVEDGKKVTLPSDPVNDPKKFWGWFDNEAQPYGNCFTGTIPITADMIVYARWDDTEPPSRIVVTFDANGGTFAGDETTQDIEVYPGEKVIPPWASNGDYLVSGWNTKADGTGTAFDKDTPVTATLTVYAQWKKPEDMPDKDRWNIWSYDSSATLDYSLIDENGTVTVTVGGTPEKQGVDNVWRAWTVSAEYFYTGIADKNYEYTFEAWTASGTRDLITQYYEDNDKAIYLNETIPITTTRTTYTVFGQPLPKSGLRKIQFQLADQTGTVYIKILEIKEYIIGKLTITNFSGNPGLPQNSYVDGNTEDLFFCSRVAFVEEHGYIIYADEVKGNTLTIPVWQVNFYEDTSVPYTGNKTVTAYNLRISSTIFKSNGDWITNDYINKVPITFTNGNATINFGTQMQKDDG